MTISSNSSPPAEAIKHGEPNIKTALLITDLLHPCHYCTICLLPVLRFVCILAVYILHIVCIYILYYLLCILYIQYIWKGKGKWEICQKWPQKGMQCTQWNLAPKFNPTSSGGTVGCPGQHPKSGDWMGTVPCSGVFLVKLFGSYVSYFCLKQY